MAESSRLDKLMKLYALDANDAFTLYAIAQEYAKTGATDDALAWYDKCIEADKDYCYAYYHKAKALDDASRIEEAIAVLKQGMRIAQDTGESHAFAEMQDFLGMIE